MASANVKGEVCPRALTVGELLLPLIKNRPIWDYRVCSPLSLDDAFVITVTIAYTKGKGKARERGDTETYRISGVNVEKVEA